MRAWLCSLPFKINKIPLTETGQCKIGFDCGISCVVLNLFCVGGGTEQIFLSVPGRSRIIGPLRTLVPFPKERSEKGSEGGIDLILCLAITS